MASRSFSARVCLNQHYWIANRIQSDFLNAFALGALALGVARLLVIDNFQTTQLIFNLRMATYAVAVVVLGGVAWYAAKREDDSALDDAPPDRPGGRTAATSASGTDVSGHRRSSASDTCRSSDRIHSRSVLHNRDTSALPRALWADQGRRAIPNSKANDRRGSALRHSRCGR